MNLKHRTAYLGLIFMTFILSVSSCGMKTEGYGVMLWSPDELVHATGSLVPVVGVSQLNKSYDIRLDKRSPMETLPQWRMAFFKRKSQAEDYQELYGQYKELYAVAAINGLPVREEQDADAKRVYKLRGGEAVKVMERDAEQSTAGEYTGYWYKVLTDGGVTGYTFDRYLDIYTADELAGLDLSEEADEFLEHFLNNVFRPKYYRSMLVTGRIDLNRFTPGYGIFPDSATQQLLIVAEDHITTIDYTGIEKSTEDSYAFVGSTLLMIVKTNYEVNLQYADQGVQYSEDYVRIDPPIELLITQEQERRTKKVEDFYARGNLLSSTAYGTISLVEGGGFIWEDTDRLIPDVIAADAGSSGIFEFLLYPSSELLQTYDGIISFTFTSGQTAHFLYTLEQEGLRMKYLPREDDEEEILIEDDGNSPIVMFFRVSNREPE